MAITGNSLDIKGKVVEPIIEEILFENNTLAKGLVTFEDDVKANTIFTEGGADAVQCSNGLLVFLQVQGVSTVGIMK